MTIRAPLGDKRYWEEAVANGWRTNVKLLDANGKSIPITQSRLELVQRITNNLNKGVQP